MDINMIEYEKFIDVFSYFTAESFEMPPFPLLVP